MIDEKHKRHLLELEEKDILVEILITLSDIKDTLKEIQEKGLGVTRIK